MITNLNLSSNNNNFYYFEKNNKIKKINKSNSKKINSKNILLYTFDIINNLNIYQPKAFSYNFLNPILNPVMFNLENNLFANEQLLNYNNYIIECFNLKNDNSNIPFNKNDNEFFQIFPNTKDYFTQKKKEKVKCIEINNENKELKNKNKSPKMNSDLNKKVNSSFDKLNNLKKNKKLTKNIVQINSIRKCISPNANIKSEKNSQYIVKNKNDNIYQHTQHHSFNNESNNPINNYNINNNKKKDNTHKKSNQNRYHHKNNKRKVIVLTSKIKQYKKIQKEEKKIPSKSPNINLNKINKRKIENPKTIKTNISFTKTTINKRRESPINKINNTKYKIQNLQKEKNIFNKSFDILINNDIFEILSNTQIIDYSCLKDYKIDNKKLKSSNNYIEQDNKFENESIRNTGQLGQEDFIDRFSFKLK